VDVESAREMRDAVRAHLSDADVVVLAAAVADFRPASSAPVKLRRADGVPTLLLEPTDDVLADVVSRRRDGQLIIGFAAETGDALAKGRAKLARKGCDLLVVNDVSQPGAGFDGDTNEVVILSDDEEAEHVAMTTKAKVATALLARVGARLGKGAR
jgi:phosphopantothenoylcysteine decarboxylase/phosphopantothenate--cysteine ligase